MHNPSLREQPLGMRAPTVPTNDTMSILDWLRSEGRLIEAKTPVVEEKRPQEEDISVLLGEEEKYDDEE
ncbi:MAG: DUF3134 family protein [Cyanobacteria bacterium P01_A01_bin.3]